MSFFLPLLLAGRKRGLQLFELDVDLVGRLQLGNLFFQALRPGHSHRLGIPLGKVGAPRMDAFPREFKAVARKTGVDEAWLRAIAHAESYFDDHALSDKGARGVMQLMPEVIGDYGVKDPFSAKESILAGAKLLKSLDARYEGDRTLVAAAYNAGVGAVAQYAGVPPYVETQEYVAKVQALHARYRKAMKLPPLPGQLAPAR